MLEFYLAGAAATAAAFLVVESLWPSREYVHGYPNGKAYRSRQVWVGAAFVGLVWPLFWTCSFPEIVRDRMGGPGDRGPHGFA